MNRKPRVFLVDDDEDILDLLKYNLLKEGYTVKAVSDSTGAVNQVLNFKPDLIVLDLMLPGQNGIDICKAIRQDHELYDVYIFFLTAKSEDYFRKAAYSVGGDDYIEKVIGLKPLISKIAAVLKRDYVIRKGRSELREGFVEINRSEESVYINGRKIILTKSEFEILFFLAQNKGRYISVTELISSLWGSKTFMDENSMRRFLVSLQEKIGSAIIRRRHGDSYQFMQFTG